jgi:hypothetical protein
MPWFWRLITAAEATVAVRRAKVVAFIVPAQEGMNKKWILE